MSITVHKLFLTLKPWIHIEDYKREGGEENPRFRIGLLRKTSPVIVKAALVATMACVACGKMMHPFRKRGSAVYFAATCPLTVNIACSRSKAASDEYQAVRTAVES